MKTIFVIILVLTLVPSLAQQDVIYQQQIPDVGIPPVQPEPVIQKPKIAQPPPQSMRRPFKLDIETLKQYKLEVITISSIVLYILLFIKGKKSNVEIMQRYYLRVYQCIQNNFAHIGFSKISKEVPFNGQSPSESLYYASGRQNVDGIQMRFNTKKRQDLLYSILDIFVPDRDTVTVDLPMRTDLPLVFAISQKKAVKDLSEKYPDIRTMTRKFQIANLNQSYEVLGESADSVDSIVDNYVLKKLNELQGHLISIHFTDVKVLSRNSGHLRVVFNLAHKNHEHYQQGIELALYLVDKLSSFKLSANAKTKALKSREVYNQSKEKNDLEKHQEELRKKKQEKLRQEQAWLRSLPPEKQKKQEEKKKKKQFNKMMKGKSLKV